jgi:hypothetical protein
MNLTEKGFDLTFTQPLDISTATDIVNYKFSSYYYQYHSKYGSDQMDVNTIPVTKVEISNDRKKISLTLSSLKAGYVYELSLGTIKTSNGDDLANKIICYTLNKLKSGTF